MGAVHERPSYSSRVQDTGAQSTTTNVDFDCIRTSIQVQRVTL